MNQLFHAKAFEKSIYYPLLSSLADEARFRVVGVELKDCVCGKKYEAGMKCPACLAQFSGETMRRSIDERLIHCNEQPAAYLPQGRVHCNYALERWVPDRLRGCSVFDISRENLQLDPACADCGSLLLEHGVTEVRKVGGNRRTYLVSCRNCRKALGEKLAQKRYECDNYYTISYRELEAARFCPNRCELFEGVIPAEHRFAVARLYTNRRAALQECAKCSVPVPQYLWCPCCAAYGVSVRNSLPTRISVVWVKTTAFEGVRAEVADLTVNANTGLQHKLAAGIPLDSPYDVLPEIDTFPKRSSP